MNLTMVKLSCLCWCIFHFLVCLMNFCTLFFVHHSCHLSGHTCAYSLKVINWPTHHTIYPICWRSVGFVHGAMVFAVCSVIFLCICLCATFATFLFTPFLYNIKLIVFFSCHHYSLWALRALTFFAQLNTCLLVTSLVNLITVSSPIISVIISSLLNPFINCSFSLLSFSSYLHLFVLTLRWTMPSPALFFFSK